MARRRNPITDKQDRLVADTIKKTLVDRNFAKSSNIRIFKMNRPNTAFGVYISDKFLNGYIKIIPDLAINDEEWGPITDYLIVYKFIFKYKNGSTKVFENLSPSFFVSDHIRREGNVTLEMETVMRMNTLLDKFKSYYPASTPRSMQPMLSDKHLKPLYELTRKLQDEGFDRKDMMIYKDLMLFTLNDEELEIVVSLKDGRLSGYARYIGRGDIHPEAYNVSSVDQFIKKVDRYIMKRNNPGKGKRNNPSQSEIDKRIRKLDKKRSSIVWSLSHRMGRPDRHLLSQLDEIDAEIRELEEKKNFKRRSNPVGTGTLFALGLGYWLGSKSNSK